ncbi:hypothetical protein QYE76_020201 [Lolium multiflorum]|uniref:THIF-type NAD/FAD binding fold domain-containing protein n=1 Tax=Lolium multiflorum TaxID=4521 RepID=A0AAD8R7Y3_LOLMU|nr:hypothetical protein QYE76_020201 [Lolium multiflorum]
MEQPYNIFPESSPGSRLYKEEQDASPLPRCPQIRGWSLHGRVGRSRKEVEGELERLRAEREELDIRIRLLESELQTGSASPASPAGEDACGGGGACQALRGLAQDDALPADMIYRYSRHLLLPYFGVQGQRKLSRSSILVVGAGGLGSPVALYLAACGVALFPDGAKTISRGGEVQMARCDLVHLRGEALLRAVLAFLGDGTLLCLVMGEVSAAM